jgi:murein DD-endopeptidase MepM/ murein hydrolase activator NlpD
MGVDLASLRQSPIPAANSGRVVQTENIGIYGNTVVIDHGLGLFSMYSHLSRFVAQPGQQVKKGDVIGYTGTSGLAAGDHLHFAMTVRHVFVNPIEWWDESWIKNNITSKIQDVNLLYP